MSTSQPRLTSLTVLLLTVPPLLWAGNAVVGRLVRELVSPLTLNFVRWVIAFVLLLPLAASVLRSGSPLWAHWKRYAVLGLLGIGLYNAFQYMALQTSTPINVTLIASSAPVWMLAIGAIAYGERPRVGQALGALLSLAGVLVVLVRGDLERVASIRLVVGDLWMLVASLSWSLYSWQLARPPASLRGAARPAWTWAEFILVQALFGLVWAGAAAGVEALASERRLVWTPALLPALAFLAVGPSVVAYRCWGLGVAAAGPTLAGFFSNLTPLFAALLSAALLGEPPRLFHAVAFALIVGGILVSSRR
jgi:drug/metabolite transporter (DMT)-like permease